MQETIFLGIYNFQEYKLCLTQYIKIICTYWNDYSNTVASITTVQQDYT